MVFWLLTSEQLLVEAGRESARYYMLELLPPYLQPTVRYYLTTAQGYIALRPAHVEQASASA